MLSGSNDFQAASCLRGVILVAWWLLKPLWTGWATRKSEQLSHMMFDCEVRRGGRADFIISSDIILLRPKVLTLEKQGWCISWAFSLQLHRIIGTENYSNEYFRLKLFRLLFYSTHTWCVFWTWCSYFLLSFHLAPFTLHQ